MNVMPKPIEAALLFRRKCPKKFDDIAFTAKLVKDACSNAIDLFAASTIGFPAFENPSHLQVVFGPERLTDDDGKATTKAKPSYYWVRITTLVLGEQQIPKRFRRNRRNGLLKSRWI